jgi:2-methylcitrate dehydratase PrpD
VTTISEDLARFSKELKLSDVPQEVIRKVRMHILDTLGAAFVGAPMPWVRPARDYVLAFGRSGSCHVVRLPTKSLDPEEAAAVNATNAHACEIDDRHVATGHVGCVIVPSCLAAAEDVSASGSRCLLANVVAYEIASRVGMAATMSAALDRGFHNTGVYNGFGVAAGAGLLMGLSANELVHALGIAGSHASGLAVGTPTGVGRYHGGIAGAAGIRSARLAKLGMTGPAAVFEGAGGRGGYLESYSAHPEPSLLTDNLGDEWGLMGNRIKRYPVNGTTFNQIDALESVLAANDIHFSEIRHIRVGVDPMAFGTSRAGGPVKPEDFLGSSFIAAYILAVRAVKRSNDFVTCLEEFRTGYNDPDVLHVAELVEHYVEPEAEAVFPDHWLAKVTVVTNEGRSFEGRAVDEPELDQAAVESKFRNLVGEALQADRMEEVIALVNSMEDLETVSGIFDLLQVPA